MVEATISSGKESKMSEAEMRAGVRALIDGFLQLAGTNPTLLSPSVLFQVDGVDVDLSTVYSASPRGRKVIFTETYYAEGRHARHTKMQGITVEDGQSPSITTWGHVVGQVEKPHRNSIEALSLADQLLAKYKAEEV
jgi:hypothetical protein